jgi:hypothetical protein
LYLRFFEEIKLFLSSSPSPTHINWTYESKRKVVVKVVRLLSGRFSVSVGRVYLHLVLRFEKYPGCADFEGKKKQFNYGPFRVRTFINDVIREHS